MRRPQCGERYAAGLASRDELLEAESASYHSAGTCTFYGTANSNQVLLEAMGLQLPGSSFVNPGTPLRAALTDAATARALEITALGNDYRPIGRLVDERAIVNAIVALIATGGSTNHTIHWLAVARAAGILLTWDDIDDLAQVVPLLARVYPNGAADVNRFAAAGGTPFVFGELIDAGWLHGDVATIVGDGLRAYTTEPRLIDGAAHAGTGVAMSADEEVVRPASRPFEANGGLRLLSGNLGRAMIKLSAIAPEQRIIEAPAVVIDNPQALNKLHAAGALPRDFIAVVRFQGPRANGMPEMHTLTPLLGMLQNQGRRVALVTDGRLSGASGKIPSAIHVTPEAAARRPARQAAPGRHDPARRRGRRARSAGRCRRVGRAPQRHRQHPAGARPGPQPVRHQSPGGHASGRGCPVDLLRPGAFRCPRGHQSRCRVRTRARRHRRPARRQGCLNEQRFLPRCAPEVALRLLRDAGILPIVTVDSLDQARAVAEALQRGGLHCIELTLRTPMALAAMAMLKHEYPALVIGAGTVLTPDHIAAAEQAGADFLVTPGASPSMIRALAACTLPVVPGAATPSELLTLVEHGFQGGKAISCRGRRRHHHAQGAARSVARPEVLPHWRYRRSRCRGLSRPAQRRVYWRLVDGAEIVAARRTVGQGQRVRCARQGDYRREVERSLPDLPRRGTNHWPLSTAATRKGMLAWPAWPLPSCT